MRRAALVVSLAVALTVSAAHGNAATPRAGATSPGRNGRIAYMRKDANGHWQVWVANERLVAAKRLTGEPADSGWPAWSRDGRKLAFDSSRTDPDPADSKQVNDIFVMNPDGSGVTKLTDSSGASADAAWSPDGSLIAFDADRGDYPAKQGIYVIDNHGGNRRRVTTVPANAANDLSPRFSPDGTRLVFTRYRGKGGAEKAALFTVHLDGSDLHQLTSFSIHAGDADWSPDGRRIVFEAYRTRMPSATSTSWAPTAAAPATSPVILREKRGPQIRSGRPMDARSSSSTTAACAEWQEPVSPR